MRVQIVTPETYFGTVSGDLSRRRGVVNDSTIRGDQRVIEATGAPAGDVRLCHRTAEPDPGAGQLDHGAVALRRRSAVSVATQFLLIIEVMSVCARCRAGADLRPIIRNRRGSAGMPTKSRKITVDRGLTRAAQMAKLTGLRPTRANPVVVEV